MMRLRGCSGRYRTRRSLRPGDTEVVQGDGGRGSLDLAADWRKESGQPLLSIRGLNVSFLVGRKTVDIVRDLDLDIMPDSIVCIVGETGCGKSVTATSVLHLLPDNARVTGSIRFKGCEVAGLSDEEYRALRGHEIMSIPQNPTASLDPLMRVGSQVEECVEVIHRFRERERRLRGGDDERRQEVVRLFERLALPKPDETYRRYPCELSGGMNQRVLISMGAITHPWLLVVDEPTKAIDWSLRRSVFELLQSLKDDMSCAMMLITHDIPLARKLADRVAVMYAGRIVEQGACADVLGHPRHPYTEGLLGSLPENGFKPMAGFMPSFDDLPRGCSFWPRCVYATEECRSELPPCQDLGEHTVQCWHPLVLSGHRDAREVDAG
ncbi:MAG: ABC transporter ATP-binding protein [Actinomycetota bacterium]|nr:ABC transporter ATP-binding protein [Actinomycetota bacterium]